MLAQSPSSAGLSHFYGKIYEAAALDVLSKGGGFRMFDMQTGVESLLSLPPALNVTYFRDVVQLRTLYAADPRQLLVFQAAGVSPLSMPCCLAAA